MNAIPPFRTGLGAAFCAVLALVLTSCTSPVEKRIVSNPDIYNRLPANDQALVSQGRIREGMSKEAVFLAWGRPDDVAAGSQKGQRVEKWTYVGSRPVHTQTFGMGMGMGWGGYGMGRFGRGYGYGWGYGGPWDPFWGGYGQGVAYIPYKAGSVTFRANRVIEYMRGPQ